MTNFTAKQIAWWRQQTIDKKMENRNILDKYSDEQLAEIFNGIGSDSFPVWLRNLISALHPSLMSVALIHDVEWYEREQKGAPASEKQDRNEFKASNARFRRNGFKAAKGYCWIRRNFIRWHAIKFEWACNRRAGYRSWKS